ncbi:hypothetical protein AAA799O18_00775, partial [Marine Group I thaumarchaeote SCGC AAA799-O18]
EMSPAPFATSLTFAMLSSLSESGSNESFSPIIQ